MPIISSNSITLSDGTLTADNGFMSELAAHIGPALPFIAGTLGAVSAIVVGLVIGMRARNGDEGGTYHAVYIGLVILTFTAVLFAVPTIVETSSSWLASLSWISSIPIPPIVLGVIIATLILGSLYIINLLLNALARWITMGLIRTREPGRSPRKGTPRPRAPMMPRPVAALQTSTSGDYAIIQGRTGRFDVHHYPTGMMLSNAAGEPRGWSTINDAGEVMRAIEAAGVLDAATTPQTRGALRARLHELLPHQAAEAKG